MNDDIFIHPTKAGEEYLADAELWKKVPEFQYEAPGASWALSHYTTSAALLGAWLLGATALAAVAARRLS